MTSIPSQLDWIDSFIDEIRPYVHVRLSDRVLIRMPNLAYKLNRSGARMLHHLLGGGTVHQILEARSFDDDLPAQLYTFFIDLSRTLNSALCDEYVSPGLERVKFELGYIELPILSEVAVTWRCNIACRFCYASCQCVSVTEEESDRQELSTSDVKRVLDIIRRDAEVPSVSFTGGEPTLRPDLEELIAYASGTLKMRVNLITNGTLISEPLAEIYKEAGLASAQVSIESPDPDIHDSLVGVKGAFALSQAGLLALKKAGVAVHPHATLCTPNIPTLPHMAHFAKSLGIDRFSLNMIIPAGRGEDGDLAVKYSDVGDIILKIKSEAEAQGIRFMWYSPTPMCLFNPIPHQLGNKGCSACEGLLSVDPYGRVLPCSSWKEPLGNLLEEGFNALWFGERGRFLRSKQEAHPGCLDCEHFAVCHGACPLYFRINGHDELAPVLTELKTHLRKDQRSSP